jgi:DNA-binding transcriptional regulator GbsR (MarR family)
MYRKTSQHNDAIKRQIESNPETLKHMQASLQKKQQDDDATKHHAANEESKDIDVHSQHAHSDKPKRAAIDKQEAFLEYKQTEEGQGFDENILHFR